MKQIVSVGVVSILLLSMISPVSMSSEIPVVEYPSFLNREHSTEIQIMVDPQLEHTGNLHAALERLNTTQYYNFMPNGFRSINVPEIHINTLPTTTRSSFVSYLESIEVSEGPNGHDFNSTAYKQGEQHVFTNITGRSYDAEKALDWLANNAWDGKNNVNTLYLFNMTDLDDGIDHWFTIKPSDIDTGEMQESFFSGTTGLVNGKSVSAWGGHQDQPIHFIDFSAEVWFGDFINTVWGEYDWSDTLLSHKIQDFGDNELPELEQWLADYTHSFFVTTYDLNLFINAPLGESVKIQTLALFDWHDYNLSINDAQWLINSNKINSSFSTSFDWLEFNVTGEWHNLTAYPDLLREISRYKTPKENGTGYYIELNNGLLTYLRDEFVPRAFDFSGEDIILPSLVILLNHSTFTYGGIPIAGIGGIGFQLQGLTPDRYYGSDGTPNRGLSDVILHEVGHSLGLPHPFSNNDQWVGDMTASVMGYYTSAPAFSQYDVNALGFYHSDFYLMQAEYIQSQYNNSDPRSSVIDQYIDKAGELQSHWDFAGAIDHAKVAICGYADIYNVSDAGCNNVDISVLNQRSDTLDISSSTTDNDNFKIGILETTQLLGLVSVLLLPVLLRRYKANKPEIT